MKKVIIALCSVFLTLLPLCLTACGIDEAKINGIYASVVLPDTDNYSDALADLGTSAQNDYILQTDGEYDLTVEFTASGGSKYPILHVDDIVLRYDTDVFEIQKPAEEYIQVARFRLTIKRPATLSAVIIEVDGYCFTVVISAK